MTQLLSTPDREEADFIVADIVSTFSKPFRSPVIGRPSDLGLKYEDITFPSLDGVPLEGWFIPCEGSDKLVICNHPLWFSRTGLPAHLEPWKSIGGAAGNDFEVNFLADYKILHDAGYSVLAYDLRNFGHSGAANGGIGSVGIFEARDVVGSLIYARTHPSLKNMKVGLFSRCMDCNATFFAMQKYPEYFKNVCCMIAPQPISMRMAMTRALKLVGLLDRIDEIEEKIFLVTSLRLDDMDPREPAKHNHVPTFMYQVHDDLLTVPSNVQEIFDNMPVKEKQLHWIRNTTRRWDGYLYFQREPQLMLSWLAKYMQ